MQNKFNYHSNLYKINYTYSYNQIGWFQSSVSQSTLDFLFMEIISIHNVSTIYKEIPKLLYFFGATRAECFPSPICFIISLLRKFPISQEYCTNNENVLMGTSGNYSSEFLQGQRLSKKNLMYFDARYGVTLHQI